MTPLQLSALLIELLELPGETEWVEWKHNNADPEMIAKLISALSNSAALHDLEFAYLVWGVEDGTQKVIGTTFRPKQAKKGNEELKNWLLRSLHPEVDFEVHEWTHHGVSMAMFQIPRASNHPVRFGREAFIRIGSLTKKLSEYDVKAKALYATLNRKSFETGIAQTDVDGAEVLTLLDYDRCLKLLQIPLPTDQKGILHKLTDEMFIVSKPGGKYDITNLGAMLFATDLSEFGRLERKAIRIIKYKGDNRTETEREWRDAPSKTGYAVAFEAVVAFIKSLLPQNEPIGKAFSTEIRVYPDQAIRELVANCLIHQDFSVTGAGPMVEIFTGRMEITNPGEPLVDTLRFIDTPPKSRNETLAAMMRRMKICEEAGTGIDKVIAAVEAFQLPAPDFVTITTTQPGSTRATLFAPRQLNDMDQTERTRACYQHACLCHVSGIKMTNTSMRGRFGIEEKNSAKASRIISETLAARLVKPSNPKQGKKYASYLPFWA